MFITEAQQRTYDELRGDYEYAEWGPIPYADGSVRVDLFDKVSDSEPANTVFIARDGSWS